MEFRNLGATDVQVSKICLGTMTFGEQNSEAEAHDQMDYAITQGINFFDTAELYAVPPRKETTGLTEQYLGTWFAKTKQRKNIILATKIAGHRPDLAFIRNHQLDYTPEQITAALDGSLNRLQTDYIDLYQLHWPNRNTNFFGKLGYHHNPHDPWEDDFILILETIEKFIKAGKIRYFGVSNETAWGVMHFIRLSEKYNLPRIVSVQNPYSLINRSFEVGIAECAIRENCGLLAYSPLAFGLLSGKYHKEEDTPRDRINRFKNLSRYNGALSWQATSRYLEIAENHGLSLAQMALAFVTQQSFTTANIIGATTLDQLKENIDSANLILSDEIIKEINEVHKAIPNPAP